MAADPVAQAKKERPEWGDIARWIDEQRAAEAETAHTEAGEPA